MASKKVIKKVADKVLVNEMKLLKVPTKRRVSKSPPSFDMPSPYSSGASSPSSSRSTPNSTPIFFIEEEELGCEDRE